MRWQTIWLLLIASLTPLGIFIATYFVHSGGLGMAFAFLAMPGLLAGMLLSALRVDKIAVWGTAFLLQALYCALLAKWLARKFGSKEPGE